MKTRGSHFAIDSKKKRIRALLVVVLAAFLSLTAAHPRAGAESPPPEESINLNAITARVDAALAAIQQSIDEIAAPENTTVKDLKDDAPHRLLFIEGNGNVPPESHPVLQHVRFITQNYNLALEHQQVTLDDGAILFGFLIFEPFEMLKFAWTALPFDNLQCSIADLADVESLQDTGEFHDVVLTEGAARRINRLSALHGQRRIQTVPNVLNNGYFTWVPGLRTIPGLYLKGRQDAHAFVGNTLPGRVSQHAAARERLREELGLPDDIAWTISAAPLPQRHPLYIAGLHDPVRHGDHSGLLLPTFENTGSGTSWLELSFVILPPHSRILKSTPGGVALHIGHPLPQADSMEEAFYQELSFNLGNRIALVVNGRVAGTAILESRRPEVLEFNVAPEWIQTTAAAWRAAGGVAELPEQTAKAPEPALEAPDTFQVRLMAEPQDRQYVPVTHFEAPGARRGIQVAVRREVILDGRAVTGAHLDPDGATLRLNLTPEGLDALGGACFGNMGKQLAILYKDRLLCAPTIDDWEMEELSFKGMDGDWIEVAKDLMSHLAEKG